MTTLAAYLAGTLTAVSLWLCAWGVSGMHGAVVWAGVVMLVGSVFGTMALLGSERTR